MKTVKKIFLSVSLIAVVLLGSQSLNGGVDQLAGPTDPIIDRSSVETNGPLDPIIDR